MGKYFDHWTPNVHPICENDGMIIGASFVVLEPELQEMIGSMRPGERRKLAEKMKRWVHQLEVSANVIEAREAPRPKPKLKWLPKEKAELN